MMTAVEVKSGGERTNQISGWSVGRQQCTHQRGESRDIELSLELGECQVLRPRRGKVLPPRPVSKAQGRGRGTVRPGQGRGCHCGRGPIASPKEGTRPSVPSGAPDASQACT